MHEYDTALKSVLQRPGGNAIALLTGFSVERWHNVELPEVKSPRVDMLGESTAGRLVHIELQSTNDPDMALRMAEYALAIFRQFRRWPRQIVLYLREAPAATEPVLEGHSFCFRYRAVDIGELDGEPLLESDHLEDNIVAVLMRLRDRREAVRRILTRIARSEPERRGKALLQLAILAGLRNVAAVIEEERTKMPILDDIMDHEVFGPKLRKAHEAGRNEGRSEGWAEGRSEGLAEGRSKGWAEGRSEGELAITRRLIERRFGPLPAWACRRLDSLSLAEIENIALRAIDAQNLEQLLS